MRIGGIYPALITPFDAQGRFDPAAQARLIDVLLSRGVDGFFVVGSAGEAMLLSPAERQTVIESAVAAVKGRCPVIAHVGCVDEAGTLALACHARRCGADAVAAVPPFYYPHGFAALKKSVERMAGEAQLPFFYYHIPMMTHVELNLDQMEQLLALPGVAGLKNTCHDQRFITLAHTMGRSAFCGLEHVLLGGLALGAVGAVGSSFNVMPDPFVRILALFKTGDLSDALALQQQALADLRVLDAGGGIPAIKYILTRLGLPCGTARPPFEQPGSDARIALDALAARLTLA